MHTTSLARNTIRLLALGAIIALLLTPTRADPLAPPGAQPLLAQHSRPRHIGYGISVAPHLPSHPELLDEMGLDWVMVYSTAQLEDFPNQHVLYRIDFSPNPGDLEDWVDGLYDLAAELNAAGVDAVQIGNEPNLAFEWHGKSPNARFFTTALCRGYRVFKEVAPNIVVVGAGIASTITTPDRGAITDLDFTQEMLNYGAGQCFDAFGYHPYGYNQPPEADPAQYELVFRRTERMYKLLWNNGIRDKQIWITEFGWVRDPAEAGRDYCRTDSEFSSFDWIKFPAELQAAYTARAFAFADSNWPWAGPMFLWNLNWNQYSPLELSPCSHMRWYAVLDEGSQPLPVFYTIKQLEKRSPYEYRPTVSAVVHGLTRTAEAGCAGAMRLGSFTVRNSGYPGHLDVEIEPANGPNRPVVWTDADHAISGTDVEVFVDATGIQPGLHLIAINLRAYGTRRMSSHVVRGWLLIHYPTSPECVARYGG